jgi:hypothetical protein
MMDGGVSHVSKMAAQREEEEESRDSRVPRFGTDNAVGRCLFVPFLLFAYFIDCIVFFQQLEPYRPIGANSPVRKKGLCAIRATVICVLSADSGSVFGMVWFYLQSHRRCPRYRDQIIKLRKGFSCSVECRFPVG